MGGVPTSAATCCLIELIVEVSTILSASFETVTVEEVVVLVMVPLLPFPVVPLPVSVPVAATAVAPASATPVGTCVSLLAADVALSVPAPASEDSASVSSSVVTMVVTVVVVVVTEGCTFDGVDPMDDINEANEIAHQDDGALTTAESDFPFELPSPLVLFSVSPPVSPSPLPLLSEGEGGGGGASGLVEGSCWSCLLVSRLCTALNSLTVGSGIAFRIVMSSFTCAGLAFCRALTACFFWKVSTCVSWFEPIPQV